MRAGWLFAVMIAALALGIAGCGAKGPPGKHEGDPAHKQRGGDGDGERLADAGEADKDDLWNNAAGPQGEPPDDAVPQAADPLIRSLERVLDSSPQIEGQDEARRIARQADSILLQARRDNREAIRQANRQIRPRGMDSPNFILIVLDALGCRLLSGDGQAKSQAPNIDRLAAQGIRFAECSGGSAQDQAAQWSLMTGLRPSRVQADTPLALRPGSAHLAEVLWRAGYATAVVGDCSLAGTIATGSPRDHGFDEWFGHRTRQSARQPYPDSLWGNGAQMKVLANSGGKQGLHGLDLLAKEALAYLERNRGARPFFLYLLLVAPDSKPEQATEPASAASGKPPSPAPEVEFIRRLDDAVGMIRDRLANLRLSTNTVIVLTGEGSPAPLIIRAPGRFPGNRVVSEPCGACDLLPTMAELAGAMRRPRSSDGVSLVPILRGQ